MKNNYNQIMYEQISSFATKPKLVLHCCCAPCSSAVIEKIKDYFDITFLYFNPNIYPESEYVKRKNEFAKLGVKIVELGYNHEEFLNLVKGKEHEKEGGQRCKLCIAYRMERAFKFAAENNIKLVTTSLSTSPHKDAEFINKTGEALEKKYGIKFLHSDFKKQDGYLHSIKICQNLNIYRQSYCGCEFSMPNKQN